MPSPGCELTCMHQMLSRRHISTLTTKIRHSVLLVNPLVFMGLALLGKECVHAGIVINALNLKWQGELLTLPFGWDDCGIQEHHGRTEL
eukprot:1140415-Pelagomonas_calceolata.AAC.1